MSAGGHGLRTIHGATGQGQPSYLDTRVAVMVDCDNTMPAILDHALRMMAQFGRVVLRRGYGNHATLGHRWQDALVQQAFTPHLQFQYAAGKNTADIALALDALEAMFDQRADVFCLVTSDSDFAYLCRKLRERGAVVCIVGEAKTPAALRNASDHFFEWAPAPQRAAEPAAPSDGLRRTAVPAAERSADAAVQLPDPILEAIGLLAGSAVEGRVNLGALGVYLKRTDPGFSPAAHGYSGLLSMLKAYPGLQLNKEVGGHYTVRLAAPLGRVTERPDLPV